MAIPSIHSDLNATVPINKSASALTPHPTCRRFLTVDLASHGINHRAVINQLVTNTQARITDHAAIIDHPFPF